MQVTIRNYEPKNLADCRALWRELTQWHREIYDDPTIGGATPELKFDEHLAAVGMGHVWVAIEQSNIVGMVGMISSI